jgi:molybdopterin-containing oxidoreductase family iron-sulfur binding subunit
MSKTIPPTCPEPQTGLKYWRGLDELAETPEFQSWVEREFPSGASELTDPVSRRHFVKIMSASFLLAGVGLGVSGCRRPEEKILPFSRLPENYVHGVSQFYATAFPTRAGAIPLLAKSNDGRPTKVEGNAQHPDSNGGTDRFAQASILNLYDPDRTNTYKGPKPGKEAALDFLATLSKQADAKKGDGLCFLLEKSHSPSRARLQRLIRAKFPQARWFVYEPLDFDIHRKAATIATGQPVAPYFQFDKAKRILSLDCDFIGAEEDNHRFIRDFAKGRKIENPEAKKDEELINRLYVVESLLSLTGANADHRLRITSSQVVQVAAALAKQLVTSGSAEFGSIVSQIPPLTGDAAKWVSECAKDLSNHAGTSLVVAGYRQPLAVHLLANAINSALGNNGKTVTFSETPDTGEGTLAELAKVLNDEKAGTVDSLIIVGGNPAYNAPVELDWLKAQRKAKTVVRLGYYEDETAAATDWQLPLAHYLESWGDVRTSDGTLVPVQPLIAPLFDGLTELELLARVGGLDTTSPYEIVRDTFRAVAPAWNFTESWNQFLHDGFFVGDKPKTIATAINWEAINPELAKVKVAAAPAKDSLEVIFHRDYKVDDGRYNNNGWLQELPDPITKIVWENVFLVSQKTFESFGFIKKDNESGHAFVPWVKLELNGRSVEGPVWLQPGQADNTVGVALGYGRTKSGRVGNGSGFNGYALRTGDAAYIATGGKLSLVAGKAPYPVSTTQSHWAMEGRPVVREANVAQFAERPDFAKGMNMPEAPGGDHPLYPNPLDIPDKNGIKPRDKTPHAWGMSIDLNACVGCSACMVACQSENNVPIVGKDLVGKSREMHWIRIDRYFTGSIADPQVVTQPMLCQHCESAPCESVCPVNATVHDEEGLNVMAYNRCVGTRYCSNNCPYKVRRFNYLDYNKRPLDKLKGPVFSTPLLNTVDGEWELARWWRDPNRGIRPQDEWELLKLAKNPDVTVRMRGVMEKCTFCIQRIEGAKIAQKVKAGASDHVEVPDGTFTSACAQACPAGAIVFGNTKDPNSRVSKLKAQERDYTVLEFLLTKPRTTYLARVRNPNPEMPDYTKAPASFEEWEKKGNHLGHEEENEHAKPVAEKGAI